MVKIHTDSQQKTFWFFDKTTFFKGDRHEVVLPFKQEIIPDANKNQSKSLSSNSFKNKPDLLQKHDEIIEEQVALETVEPITD